MTQTILLIALGCGQSDDTSQATDSSDTATDTSVVDTGSNTGEVLLFSDDFDEFDASKWMVVDGEVGSTTIKSENISALDGELLLSVSRDAEADPPEWFGGAIESAGKNRFGVWEARIKAQGTSGTICSFFLRDEMALPQNDQPTDRYVLNQTGFQIFDDTIKIDSYAQWRREDGEDGSPTHEGFYFAPFEFDFGAWHTYRIEWDHFSITFYVDGERWADVLDVVPNDDLSVHLAHWSYADEANGGEPSLTEDSACLVDYVRGEGFLAGEVSPPE